MGVISSLCKPKKPTKHTTIIHDDFIQTINTSKNSSSDSTQCSAIIREPTNNVSYGYRCHPPSNQQIRGHPDFPLFSTPFFLPVNGQNDIFYRRSNPYIAQASNHIDVSITPPMIINKDHSSETSTSDIIQTTSEEHQMELSMTTDKNEQINKTSTNDESHLVKRAISTPIDMFLIDISNECVLVGQPVSMNIRHLLLDTLENHHMNSSTPVRIEPTSITTYAHENLLNYIPYVCEKYPNNTINIDQATRNTLHVRIPSQFSRSLNSLT